MPIELFWGLVELAPLAVQAAANDVRRIVRPAPIPGCDVVVAALHLRELDPAVEALIGEQGEVGPEDHTPPPQPSCLGVEARGDTG